MSLQGILWSHVCSREMPSASGMMSQLRTITLGLLGCTSPLRQPVSISYQPDMCQRGFQSSGFILFTDYSPQLSESR